ncbi:MAG: DegQ family serine endoprotease [Myxococcota bacterium]
MLKSIAQSLFLLSFGSLATVAVFNCSPRPAVESTRKLAETVFLPGPAFAETTGRSGVVIADVAERVVPSVVNVSTEKVAQRAERRGPFNDPLFRQFFGERFRQMPRERLERSAGSGVIVDASGVILTNNHVIDGATTIRVTLSDGRELDAEKIGTDPESDIGVLKLKEPVEDLEAIRFGNADSLRLGDIVLAVGNPFGVGQTVTMGIVSAKGRSNVGIVDYEDFIQTDAAINPGNSGGALVNSRGELVGINTAILSRSGGYQGIGFAIPSNMAKQIMDSLLDDGTVSRGFLGISIQNVDRNLAEAMGLDDTRGVLVGGVNSDSPAEQGGLEAGDVILKVNDKEVTNTGELRNAIALAGAGNSVQLEVVRESKRKTLTVELGEKPGSGSPRAEVPNVDKDESAAGLTVASLDAAIRERFRLGDSAELGAVVVVEVERGSPAARAGIRPGDLIRKAGSERIESPADLKRMFGSGRSVIPVLVQRGDVTQFVALRLKE